MVSANEIAQARILKWRFKITLWTVLALTTVGLPWTLLLLRDLDSGSNEDENFSGLAILLILGVVSWALVGRTYFVWSQSPNSRLAQDLVKTFGELRPQLSMWLKTFRTLHEDLNHALFQVDCCSGSSGEFVAAFSNGIKIHKQYLGQGGSVLGCLRDVTSVFSDNTSTQTYVSSSSSRGQITQDHFDKEQFRINADTSHNVSSRRVGSAYVFIEGPELTPMTLAFNDPNEARNCSNLINELSRYYDGSAESREADLAKWKNRQIECQDALSEFLISTTDFRKRVRAFGVDVVVFEYTRASFGFGDKLSQLELEALVSN